MKTERQIAQLAQMACIWEACAPKPGNVNRHHDFSDTSLEDFLASAIAMGPAFENAGPKSVGEIIWQGITRTRQWVRSNTNLGLILLLAPLVKACLTAFGTNDIVQIRLCLGDVLHALTVEDARLAYAAIRLAQPSGLAQVSQADVKEEPSITLLQAMVLAQDRDSIAHEYATNFSITFETGLPALMDAMSRGGDFSDAVVQTFLTILSRVPDTLIARKKGLESAHQVTQRAVGVLAEGGIFTPRGRSALESMDRALRDANHALNPGTTADLTAAAVFLALFESQDSCGQDLRSLSPY